MSYNTGQFANESIYIVYIYSIDMKVLVTCWLVFALTPKVKTDILEHAIVVMRHGDIIPLGTYPSDPFEDTVNLWGQRMGQLTGLGKIEMFNVGRSLRKRHGSLISTSDYELEIHSKRSLRDHVSQSAAIASAAFLNYSAVQYSVAQITNEKKFDYLLSEYECPKYKELYDNVYSSYSQKFLHNRAMLKEISEDTGKIMATLKDIKEIYDILKIQERLVSAMKKSLPPWSSKIFSEEIKIMANIALKSGAENPELQRFRSGPLLNHIKLNIEKMTEEGEAADEKKMIWYVADEVVLANLWQSLQLQTPKEPELKNKTIPLLIDQFPFGSMLLFEIYKDFDNHIIRIFLSTTSDDYIEMEINECSEPCALNQFLDSFDSLALEDIPRECEYPSYVCVFCNSNSTKVIAWLITAVIFLSIGILGICAVSFLRRKRKMEQKIFDALLDAVNPSAKNIV